MKKVKVLSVLLAAAALGVAFNANYQQHDREQAQFVHYSRRVFPGQTLWEICSKLDTKEDVRAVIDRARLDNNIKNPGTLQPGQVILIRVKK